MSEAIPDEEKLAIANHFLLSSPPGEIKEVLADVKVVLNPPTLLTDGHLKTVFRKYNIANAETVEWKGKPVVLSEYGALDAKHFLAGSGEVIEVDHVAQKASAPAEDAPKHAAGPLEATRSAVQAALDDYVNIQFAAGCATVSVFETKEGGLVAVICGQKSNPPNFWTGKWRSEWNFDPKAKSGSGKTKVHIHYFEAGNVQMEQTKEIPKTSLKVGGSDDKAFAEAVKGFVSEQEGMIQATTEEMYLSMSGETFKDMRRILPLTQTKLDWTGAQMKLAGAMGQSKGQ